MSVEWNGRGKPPAGCLVELMDDSQSSTWGNVTIKFWGDSFAVWDDHGEECSNSLYHVNVRPIRTEAERKRDEAISALVAVLNEGTSTEDDDRGIYSAIAAGKIPHITLK